VFIILANVTRQRNNDEYDLVQLFVTSKYKSVAIA
jgi:hypothetical protein